METLDTAITHINAHLRQDRSVDVPTAALYALSTAVQSAKKRGYDNEEQLDLFEVFGQAALRVSYAQQLTSMLSAHDNDEITAFLKHVEDHTVDDLDEDFIPNGPEVPQDPELFLIIGGKTDDSPTIPRRTGHLHVVKDSPVL